MEPFIPITIVGCLLICGIIFAIKFDKKRKKFIATHKIKCKRCGTTNTVYICMTTHSYSSGKSSSRSTTYYGHDKFCCNNCKSNHYIENGDWIDEAGNVCNIEAKKIGLYR